MTIVQYGSPKLMDLQDAGAPTVEPTELLIVEGDSAARSIDRVRNPSFQAILPMQGKPMNAWRCGFKTLRANVQFAALLSALGLDGDLGGASLLSDSLVRYERIILLFDPDADGIHGRTLMLMFFHRWLPQLIEAGRLFDSHAPQWEVNGRGMDKSAYAATPQHLADLKTRLTARGVTHIRTRRFRGLGSISPEILQDRCVDPDTRILTPLTVEYAALAKSMLMAG